MFAFLARKLVEKFFPHIVACMARRRATLYAEREARRRQARYVRLRLEDLEGRIAPAAYQWFGPSGDPWTNGQDWQNTATGAVGTVPGSLDTADIPSGTYCVLNSTNSQTVAGLTVEGRLDVGSKLSVTTATMAFGSTFNLLAGGLVDVLGSADLGGAGTLNAQIDAQGSSVTFDPSSTMTLATGANLTGSLFNLFGPVNVTGAISQSARMVLSNDGSTTAGSLTGTGSLSDGGEFDWNGGSIGLTGSGGATFLANADLKLQGGDNKTVSAGTLTNQCNGSEIGGTGTLIINPGATWDNLGNPNCDVTIGSILVRGSFINDADGFFDAKGDTTISGNFSNIGTLEVASASSLTVNSGGSPSAALDGTLQLDGDLTLLGTILSPTGFIQDAGGGTIHVGGSGSGSLSVASGYEALLSGNVEVSGSGTLGGAGEVYNNGKLTVDVGGTTSLGSYQQTSAGTLALQASGVDVFSSLAVNGAAQLSGTLELDFLNGYTPTSGTTFPVLTAASLGAHFDTTPANMTANYTSTGGSVTEH